MCPERSHLSESTRYQDPKCVDEQELRVPSRAGSPVPAAIIAAMTSNPVTIGQFVREHRETLGLSMTALADATGLSRSTIDRTENAKRGINPEPRTLAKVLVALNVSEDSIRELLEPSSYRNDVLYESANPRLITRRQEQDPLVAAINRLAEAIERSLT